MADPSEQRAPIVMVCQRIRAGWMPKPVFRKANPETAPDDGLNPSIRQELEG